MEQQDDAKKVDFPELEDFRALPDYYSILGLEPSVSQPEISVRYEDLYQTFLLDKTLQV